jgi:ribonuclease VapC
VGGGAAAVISFAVDSSAIIAVLNDEPDALAFKEAFHEADHVLISTATLFETTCVVVNERFPNGGTRLDELIDLLALSIIPFDANHLAAARAAYSRFGRGSGHRANLNMGDCFSYALAKTRYVPLLFKGDDFVHTDIEPALKPA